MRRDFLKAALATGLISGFPAIRASAQAKNEIRLVSPFVFGGMVDIVGRPIAEALSKVLGQTVVVENQGGRAGMVATEAVLKGAKEGGNYFLMGTSGMFSQNKLLYLNASLSAPLEDLQPAATLAYGPHILVVNPSVPAASLKEFIELLEKKPETTSFGIALGSAPYATALLMRQLLQHRSEMLPTRGAGANVKGAISGDFSAAIEVASILIEPVRAQKLRALAVLSGHRAAALPEVPTSAEAGLPDLVNDTHLVLSSPKGMPAEIVDRVVRGFQEALSIPGLIKDVEERGARPNFGKADAFRRLIDAETVRWTPVLKDVHLD